MGHTIWMDLTDLRAWQGHLTGIQRVVFNVAEQLALSNPDAKFFVFDDRTRSFRKFAFSALGGRQSASAEADAGAGARHDPPPAQWLRARLKQRVSYMTRQDLHAIREASLRVLQRARPVLPRLVRSPAAGERVRFGATDVVLVLGNFWARPALLEQLRALKEQADFRLALMLYDLIPIYGPQLFPTQIREQYTKAMLEAVAAADLLFAISDNTRRDMQRFCLASGAETPPIEVVRLADDLPAVTSIRRPRATLGDTPFVLCVGTVEVRKNHALLYYAWKEALRRGIELPALVIVGQSGWYTGDVQHLFRNDPELAGRVFLLAGVADEELAWLYRSCLFTVFPSMYEGWGLPVAESLAYGKLCVTSNVSAMPEVGGDLVDYFSPFDSGNLLECLVANLEPGERERKERRIAEHYRPVSWADVHRQILAALARHASIQ